MSRTHANPVHRIPVRAAALALGLAVGLGAAAPAAAVRPDAAAERPAWAAPVDRLAGLLAGWLGLGEPTSRAVARSEATGDGGPGMDPDGLGAEGEGGPDMDPNG